MRKRLLLSTRVHLSMNKLLTILNSCQRKRRNSPLSVGPFHNKTSSFHSLLTKHCIKAQRRIILVYRYHILLSFANNPIFFSNHPLRTADSIAIAIADRISFVEATISPSSFIFFHRPIKDVIANIFQCKSADLLNYVLLYENPQTLVGVIYFYC